MPVQILPRLSDEETANPKVLQIVEAAGRLFMADGYGATSMDAIAREAGVSKATLYAHFTDKAALFAAIIKRECERKAQILWDDSADRSDVRAVLDGVARAAIRFGTEAETLAIYRIVVGETGRFPELGRVFYETGPRRVLNRLAEYLGECSARGLLDVPEPRLAAEQFVGMVRGAHYLRRLLRIDEEPEAPDPDRIIGSAVQVFLRAYQQEAAP
ncbi:MAG TPA: TetR/AcrR family transcriptional regulator [Dongiaceae bacterium]|jgi:AcrR family transcriptional regulator